jgi:hypothetical protein
LSYSVFTLSLTEAQKTNPQKLSSYFPAPGSWQEKLPSALGLKDAVIKAAIDSAIIHESKNPRNMEINHYQTFGREPFGEGIGPFADRGEPTGIIVYKGYIIASWGNPDRCDMTHSVTKSFLSTVIGKAIDSGLIKNVFDTVAAYIPPIELYGQPVNRSPDLVGQPQLVELFKTEHNKTITWNDMLRQTSDWKALSGENQIGLIVLMQIRKPGKPGREMRVARFTNTMMFV